MWAGADVQLVICNSRKLAMILTWEDWCAAQLSMSSMAQRRLHYVLLHVTVL